jgi:hypothetical protein
VVFLALQLLRYLIPSRPGSGDSNSARSDPSRARSAAE